MAASANFQAPWPFASVWQLVKDLAKMNAGKDYQEYPIYSVDPATIKLQPSDKLNSEDAEKFNKQNPRHRLLEAFWRCCFYVCEKYTSVSEDELDNFLEDPQLEELVTNLYSQLQPDCEFLYTDQHHRSMFRASLKAAAQAINLIVDKSTPSAPTACNNRASLQSNDGPLIAARLLSKLELVSHLWELREERQRHHAQHYRKYDDDWDFSNYVYIFPFRACEGDDLGLHAYSSMTNPDEVVVYRFYERSYIQELENMLVSLKTLLFHIINRLDSRNKSTMSESDHQEANVHEFELCWTISEELNGLTYRFGTTQEGWMIYELRQQAWAAAPELESAYPESELLIWEENPWAKFCASRRTALRSEAAYQSTSSSTHIGVSSPSSTLKRSGSDTEIANSAVKPPILNELESQLHTNHLPGTASTTDRKSTLTTTHPDGQAVNTRPKPTSWAALLSPPNWTSAPGPVVPPAQVATSSNSGGKSFYHEFVSAESKSSSGSTVEPSDSPTLDPVDLDTLHHIRIRILLRAAAAKDGWHPQLGISLADFVRDNMSVTTFGKTEKRKKLFTDYRNAMVNPQNNIKTRGDIAAHRATVAQIKRAVEWKTAAGKHQFLKDLFRAVVGLELDQVDDETDRSLNG
ncbi:hypothetical protein BDZ91DRAFT_783679 [Kalaharituber pfeilii]|nr:hypothetical protein BDZ91DRAFT_783679 [Kalaharituber pfeilii]